MVKTVKDVFVYTTILKHSIQEPNDFFIFPIRKVVDLRFSENILKI